MKKRTINRTIFLCFFIAAILRLLYLITPRLNSDHAVIGLAARHILKGEFPVFFYGSPFEGVIEGYLAAPLFFFFGSSRFVLDCVPALMSLVLIYTIYKLAQTIFGYKTAKLTLIFSCLAPPYFLMSTTVPADGYIETTILGLIAFIITYKIIYAPPASVPHQPKLYFLLGLALGFAFYLHFHIVPFALTIGIILFLNDRKLIFKKYFFFLLCGSIIGSLPLLMWNFVNKFKTFKVIGKGIENSTFSGTLQKLFCNDYWVLLGAKDKGIYIPYVSALLMLLYLLSFIYLILKRKKGGELLIILLIIFPITYWLSGKSQASTSRYIIPLYPVAAILLANFLNRIREKTRLLFYGFSALILGSNIYTNLISMTIFNPTKKIHYQVELSMEKELYKFLKVNTIKGAYALSWWVSLKFNFDFKEDIILSLILNEPYPKYQKIVDSQTNPAVVSYFSELVPTFDSIAGSYKIHTILNPIQTIPPYNIYYNFAPPEQTLKELDNSRWIVQSSHNPNTASLAIDRDISTRWHSDTAQKKDMYFIIDLGKINRNVTRLCYTPGPKTDWPCGYELYTSINGKIWHYAAKNPACIAPVFWDGPHPFIRSINGLIEMDFPPTPARYLKIVLTSGKETFYWSISEIYIYSQKAKAPKDWDIERIKERLSRIKPKKIYADPWVTSHIDTKFYKITEDDTIDNNYIYKYFIVEPDRFKDYAFIVLEENYPAFIKMLEGVKYIAETFSPYRLITFSENKTNCPRLYWDGFHLLKCTY